MLQKSKYNQNITVGIVGLGFVGGAMYESFKKKGVKQLYGYDKYKNGGIGSFEEICKCDILFLALPTHYDSERKKYNLDPIYETCKSLSSNNFKGVVVIKSTVEPLTTSNLSDDFPELEFIHNPEFLTARTAYQDFHNQEHIVLGSGSTCSDKNLKITKEFYKYYYDADVSLCKSDESESMKIFANSFYSAKIQFFTEIYLLCKKTNCDYNKIIQMMIKNNWINPMHTKVPGPDGQVSYGGLCFPKDTNALNEHMKRNKTPNCVLDAVIKERNIMRDDNLNCK